MNIHDQKYCSLSPRGLDFKPQSRAVNCRILFQKKLGGITKLSSEDLQMKGTVILCNERELAQGKQKRPNNSKNARSSRSKASSNRHKPRDSEIKKINATFSFNNAMQSVNRKKAEISS